jgi:hypothetical protein
MNVVHLTSQLIESAAQCQVCLFSIVLRRYWRRYEWVIRFASAILARFSFTVLLIALFLNVRNEFRIYLAVYARAHGLVMHSTVRYNNGWFFSLCIAIHFLRL